MLFNSTEFLLFIAVTFSLYYAVPKYGFQIRLLIAASFFFYAFHNPPLLLLLLFSASINTIASYFVIQSKRHRRLFASGGVAANLGVLLFFKYSPLFSRSFLVPSSGVGDFLLDIPLPIGISFFTFQGISLCVDTYKRHSGLDALKGTTFWDHLNKTFFFKAFFPQLIAGPIVKAHDFYPQIRVRYFRDIPWDSAAKSLIVGYFLKMVIADNLKDFTFWMTYPYFETMHSLNLIAMLFGYSSQIFADFAGYSLIAIGLARLFGYELMQNFNFPYIAKSFQEFWTRWHISLSTFLKEYLYIPLGGNRKGNFRTYFNLFLTMTLGGLWHGAAWSYAIWGIFHGTLLAIERFLAQKFPELSKWTPPKAVTALKVLFVFSAVSLAWLLFKLPEFGQALSYLEAIFTNTDRGIQKVRMVCILLYTLPIIVYHFRGWRKAITGVQSKPLSEVAVYSSLLFCVLTSSGSAGAFVYFQF